MGNSPGTIAEVMPEVPARAFAWALVAFAVVNLGLIAATGARSGGDTGIYLDGARRLMEGRPLEARQPSYAGYIAIVAACQALGAGVSGLVVAQVAMATVAAASVGLMAALVGGPFAAVVAVGLLTLDIETNRWHAYVLADSLYQSVLAVAVYVIFRASEAPRSARVHLGAAGALGAASLIRPEGWLVMPAAAFLWVIRGVARSSARRTLAGAVLLACLLAAAVVAPRMRGNLEAVGPADMLRRGQTMWESERWRLVMPEEPPYAGAWGAPGDEISYATHHPVMTAALVGARLLVHAAHVRPFYSLPHNAAIIVWLVPVYAFALAGGWARRRHPMVGWLVAVLATQALVVAATHADYDGRYLSHVLPLIYPLTAAGMVTVATRRDLAPAAPAVMRA